MKKICTWDFETPNIFFDRIWPNKSLLYNFFDFFGGLLEVKYPFFDWVHPNFFLLKYSSVDLSRYMKKELNVLVEKVGN